MRSETVLICTLALLAASIAHAADETGARTVLDKAMEAAGGREALARYEMPFVMEMKVKNFTPRGVRESKGKQTRWFPDRFRDESDDSMGRGKFVMLFNGESGKYTGYTSQKGVTTGSMNESQVDQSRDRVYCERLTTLLPLAAPGFTLMMVDEIVLDGRPSVGVKISHADRPDVTLYFDKETYVLTKQVRPWRRPDGNRTSTTLYDDYVEVDGLVYPRKATRYVDDAKSYESEITDLKFLDSVDKTVFEQP